MKTTLFFSLITAFAFSYLPPASAQEGVTWTYDHLNDPDYDLELWWEEYRAWLAEMTAVPAPTWEGSGLSDDPFLIESVDHLLELFENVRTPFQGTWETFRGVHFLLTQDLDLAEWNDLHPEGWAPIGSKKTRFSNPAPFCGNFDGGGHVIKNLKGKGLFTMIRGSSFKNLGLINVDVEGGLEVGALAGSAMEYPVNEESLPTIITNCYVTGKITGNVHAGGLTGYLRKSTVSNCFADCEVYEHGVLRAANTGQKGILIGFVYSGSTVNNSYATGSIHALDHATGGLAGGIHNGGNIYNCYANVSVVTALEIPKDDHSVTVASGGGILGDNASNDGYVSNSVVLGDFISQKEYTHPVVGYLTRNTLRNNYISSNVLVNGEPFLAADKNSASGETVDHQLLFSAGFYSDPDNWSPSDAASNPLPSAWSLSPQDDSRSIWNIWEGKSLPYFQYQSAPPLISSLSDASLSGEYRTDDYARLEYIAVSVNGQHLGNAELSRGSWTFNFPSTRAAGDKVSVIVKERGKAISYSLRAVIPSKDLKEPNPPMAIQSPLSPIDTDACTSKLFTLTGVPVLSANPPAGIYLRRLSHPSLGSRTQKIVLNGH
jgi:hypothetical protein